MQPSWGERTKEGKKLGCRGRGQATGSFRGDPGCKRSEDASVIHERQGRHLTLPSKQGRAAWEGSGISQHIPGHGSQQAPSHSWLSAQLRPGLTTERGWQRPRRRWAFGRR